MKKRKTPGNKGFKDGDQKAYEEMLGQIEKPRERNIIRRAMRLLGTIRTLPKNRKKAARE